MRIMRIKTFTILTWIMFSGAVFCVIGEFAPYIVSPPAAETATLDTGAAIKKVFRLALGPDDPLLESIQKLIDREKITDGAILSCIGSLKDCRYHYPESMKFPPEDKIATITAPIELWSGQGIIADGIPHIHFSASTPDKAFGGHLENGSKVLYLAEILIAQFDGPEFTRRPNEHGVKMLQRK